MSNANPIAAMPQISQAVQFMPDAGFNVGALLGVMREIVRDTDARLQAAIREMLTTEDAKNDLTAESAKSAEESSILRVLRALRGQFWCSPRSPRFIRATSPRLPRPSFTP